MVAVPDHGDNGADSDTWDDVARLESVLARRDAMTAQTPDDLDRGARSVAETHDVDPAAFDRDLVLTRDVAHTVARPVVPLTTSLMGLAVGGSTGDRALEAVAAQVATRACADASGSGADA